ncbi:DUF1735 domain-containing protein [Lacibacter luteus]|uniref:DUF1735 domain-containing protein n=1 Tax=Lacibacter luteus TaxID=2508719 RepID=A0A4Q1CMW9_9BACT|nr:DUF1735 domain-containing protein [Lacibacter luteus]RXK62041.1 DUF1735 domain-containing protein [Lacibacter luteus]
MQKNNFYKLTAAALFTVAMGACNKPKPIELTNEGSVYMPQAVGTRAKVDLLFTSTNTRQELVFGAAYGGLKTAGSDNSVSFVVDAAKVAAYNAANGTNYTLLPATSYELSGLNTVIPAGATSSTPLTLTVKTNTVTVGVRYMLPISLSTAANGQIVSSLQTTYFRFDTLLRKSIDVTGLGTLTVSNENDGGSGAGEGSPKLIDNDINTKYLFQTWNTALATNGGAWWKLQFGTPVTVGAYTFTSANDGATRDPKDWKLQGSNDNTTWTDLDTRTGEQFAARFQTKRYEVASPQSFTYYRVFMTANNGSSLFQMAEWRVIKYE